VTGITDGAARRAYLFIHDRGVGNGDRVMTRTSDHAGVLVYSLLVTLLVLATIYLPA
jgi:hypothetical protein